MHTHSLGGELLFNEHGWGIWSDDHARNCTLRRADEAVWRVVHDQEAYNWMIKLPTPQFALQVSFCELL